MSLNAYRTIHVKVHLSDWTARLTIKALNGFLMTQKQVNLKDELWVYNVSKLHRPHILDVFLADTDYTTISSCTSAVFCALHNQLPAYIDIRS